MNDQPCGCEELRARAAITDALARYCRGVDRRDAALVESAYWPDAVDVRAGASDGATPAEFARRSTSALGDDGFSMHHTTTVLIDLDLPRGTAAVESYVLTLYPVGPGSAPHVRPPDGGRTTKFLAGRYVDHFERRDGQWRIARRHVVLDHSLDAPATATGASVPAAFRPSDAATDPSTVLWRVRPDAPRTAP